MAKTKKPNVCTLGFKGCRGGRIRTYDLPAAAGRGLGTKVQMLKRKWLKILNKKKRDRLVSLSPVLTGLLSGRGGRIRTYDLLLPKQARYRATLHPEGVLLSTSPPKGRDAIPGGVYSAISAELHPEGVLLSTSPPKGRDAIPGGVYSAISAELHPEGVLLSTSPPKGRDAIPCGVYSAISAELHPEGVLLSTSPPKGRDAIPGGVYSAFSAELHPEVVFSVTNTLISS